MHFLAKIILSLTLSPDPPTTLLDKFILSDRESTLDSDFNRRQNLTSKSTSVYNSRRYSNEADRAHKDIRYYFK